MAFAGQLPAGGPEQRLTHMQRDGTPARESNSAPASADGVGSQVANHLGREDLRKAGVMTGYHTRWARPPEQPEDPERIAIREALAFGKAVYDQSRALGLSVAGLAGRADMTTGEIECIGEGGTEPAISLLRRLATALDAVHLTAGHDLGPVRFEPHAA
jgi:hypothetical protein